MILRIFHPIGQGAFYSERHVNDNFNIVYDCGSLPERSKRPEQIVKQSFYNKTDIHILFISHFDADHVNRIKILKDNFNIHKVILPLLHDDEKLFVSKFNGIVTNNDFNTLVTNPQDFFAPSTIIISVSPDEKSKIQEEGIIEIENIIKSQKIDSGKILRWRKWIYIPFNLKNVERRKELESLFQENKLDIEKFKKNLDYATENRNDIKRIYQEVSGNINENSMIIYSGPEKSSGQHIIHSFIHCMSCNYRYCDFSFLHEKPACLFMGDYDTNNNVDLKKKYRNYWDNIGTLQIPHHGALSSFNNKILTDGGYRCVISFGTSNQYGHPSSQVVADIIEKRSCPIFVTEKTDSQYIELIEC